MHCCFTLHIPYPWIPTPIANQFQGLYRSEHPLFRSKFAPVTKSQLGLVKIVSACVQVAFQDAACTPLEVAFAHTGSLSRSWQLLGSMQLRRDDRQQLQHVFRLGAQHSIKRYLCISFFGHLLGHNSGQCCWYLSTLPYNDIMGARI